MLKIVGAGLGRTGTNSLKLALEQLLGEPCYHMYEVAAHPADAARWHAAVVKARSSRSCSFQRPSSAEKRAQTYISLTGVKKRTHGKRLTKARA